MMKLKGEHGQICVQKNICGLCDFFAKTHEIKLHIEWKHVDKLMCFVWICFRRTGNQTTHWERAWKKIEVVRVSLSHKNSRDQSTHWGKTWRNKVRLL